VQEEIARTQASWKPQTFKRCIIPLVQKIGYERSGIKSFQKLNKDQRQKTRLDAYDTFGCTYTF
jgi:hypothetical protein